MGLPLQYSRHRIVVGDEFGGAIRLGDAADALADGKARIEDVIYVPVVHIAAPVVPGSAVSNDYSANSRVSARDLQESARIIIFVGYAVA